MSDGVFRICDIELTNGIPCRTYCEYGFDVSKYGDIQSIFRARLLNCACDLVMVGRRWSCSDEVVGMVSTPLWLLPTVNTESWGGALPTPLSISLEPIEMVTELCPLLDELLRLL